MGRNTSSVAVAESTTHWEGAVAQITVRRRDEANRMRRNINVALAKAETALQGEEVVLAKAKMDYGSRSGHPKLQRAQDRWVAASRKCAQLRGASRRADKKFVSIDEERVMLHSAVRRFLNGDTPSEECGSMKLSVSEGGNLNIYFNIYFRADGLDVQKVEGGTHDGHFIIRPDGTVHGAYLRNTHRSQLR